MLSVSTAVVRSWASVKHPRLEPGHLGDQGTVGAPAPNLLHAGVPLVPLGGGRVDGTGAGREIRHTDSIASPPPWRHDHLPVMVSQPGPSCGDG
jgi:hypothetical protein